MRISWTRDEVILGLDILFSSSISFLTLNSFPIVDLSKTLRSLPIISENFRNNLFRSPSEIHRQLLTFGWSLRKGENQVRIDPEFFKVYNQFKDNLLELHKIALTIRKYANFNIAIPFGDPVESEEFPEGAILSHIHRNIEARYNLSCNNSLYECEICGLHPSKVYLVVDDNSILSKHLLIAPVDLDPDKEPTENDYITLCPNCHKTLHKLRPWRNRNDCEKILLL